MIIVDMKTLSESQLNQAAQILTDELPNGWPTLSDALYEVKERWSNDVGALFLAAVNAEEVIGWGGILQHYDGHVFELHPLAVRNDWQRKGVGRLLVDALSDAAKKKGGLTLWLGADDEIEGGETSFANVDLYDDLPRRIQEFDPGTHQTAFYMKYGFKIVGVIPDANGIGKPDIYLAKRL